MSRTILAPASAGAPSPQGPRTCAFRLCREPARAGDTFSDRYCSTACMGYDEYHRQRRTWPNSVPLAPATSSPADRRVLAGKVVEQAVLLVERLDAFPIADLAARDVERLHALLTDALGLTGRRSSRPEKL